MPSTLRFDCVEVDLAVGRLFKHGVRIHLREQSLRVLELLLARPGEVVTREELRRRLWPTDVFVDFENNLNTAVARLREALGDSAMTDDVITELAALAPGELGVIARTTAMCYRRTQKHAARIGRELSVDHIVEGGVRRTGDRIGINVQVVRAGDQEYVFAKRYDDDAAEVFGLQGRIARDLRRGVPGRGRRRGCRSWSAGPGGHAVPGVCAGSGSASRDGEPPA